MSAKRCLQCGLQIKIGGFVEHVLFPGGFYHLKCFKCATCSTSLWEKKFVVGDVNNVHCESCKKEPDLTVTPDMAEWQFVSKEDEAKYNQELSDKQLEAILNSLDT